MGGNLAGGGDIGRHRAPREEPSSGGGRSALAYLAGAIAVVLVVAGSIIAGTRFLGAEPAASDVDTCGGEPSVIATNAGLAPPLRLSLRAAGCTEMLVTVMDPATVATSIVSGTDAPDYWVPDAPAFVDRLAEATGSYPDTLVDSVASSPVVLAAPAGGELPDSWPAAVADPGLVLGDPLADASSTAPLLLASDGLSPEDTVAVIAPQAQQHAAAAAAPQNGLHRIESVDLQDSGFTATTEQWVLSSGRDVDMAVPDPGTWLLSYPLVALADGARAEQLTATSALLTDLVSSEAFAEALASSHFRGPDGAPVPQGFGKVETVEEPSVDRVSTTLRSWSTLAVPTRTLAVIDVSGSMDYATEQGSTRIALTIGATRAGLGLFPDGASIGVWAFSERLGGTTDHRELVPIRRLDAHVDGGSQRQLLAAQLGGLASLTDGGTGLYDTVLAAYLEMQEHHDPTAVNSILLFSDGANDDPGSPSLEKTIAELSRIADPDRPVSVIAIGISEDADEDALARIAEATGGFSIVAEQPEDMQELFQRAMAARFS